MNLNHYILKGRKIVKVDLMTWGAWFEKGDCIIKQETLPNGYWISTVFLGLDHNFGKGLPLLFETMVFENKYRWTKPIKNMPSFKPFKYREEMDMDRYSTYAQAEAGHAAMVKKWKRKK